MPFNEKPYKLEVLGLPGNAELKMIKDSFRTADICNIDVTSENGEKLDLSEMKIVIRTACGDIAGRWYPAKKQLDRAVHNSWEWGYQTAYMKGAPIVSYFRSDDVNRLTVALSDSFTSWHFKTGVNDEIKSLEHNCFPKLGVCGEYSVKILIDLNEIPYYDAVRNAADWWARLYGAINLPESAFEPVYSTWYAYQREIFADELVKQCRMAYDLGMRTVIIDDGWATPLNTDRYNDSGDWKPTVDKFQDMKRFVSEVHSIGMRVLLWVAPGIAGFASKAAAAYDGKFLIKSDKALNYVLDIRYPEIRENLCESFKRLVGDYDLDGLKIDFIDIISGEDREIGDGRDVVSVSQAVKLLVEQINKTLTSIKPDILIEYRQDYTGPQVAKNANIMRATDCPQDYLANRVDTVDLRLHTSAAVHSDMLQFNENEPVEISALQFTNVLFSTPQISVRFDEISSEQTQMVKFWVEFMSRKRGLLQKGHLQPHRCDAEYSYIVAEDDNERLTALYSERLLILETEKKTDYIVNAVDRGIIYIGQLKSRNVSYSILDCMGNEVKIGKTVLCENAKPFKIPFNGMMIIKQIERNET